MTERCHDLAVVIPARHEQDNIATVIIGLLQILGQTCSILIVVDDPDDPTVAAVESVDKHDALVSVHTNRYEGAMGAVRTGIELANHRWVAFVTADGSDEPEVLRRLFQAATAADAPLACATRYRHGGQMIGAPLIKGTLSRAVAYVLWHLGFPASDPTNTFFLVKRTLLERLNVETQSGFSYGLEIKAKAAAMGVRPVEVPAVWRERRHGTSSFRILATAPEYIRWFALAARTAISRR